MAYLMVADFMPEAFAAATEAGYNLNISLVSFREEGVDYRNVTKDNWQGQLNAKINSDNSADYGGAFESAERFFDDVAGADDTNLMFFIGNGQQTHSWHGERASLKSAHDVEIDAYLTDLEVNILDPNLVNMVAIDDGIIVDQSYADEVSDAQGWGMAQNMLSIDEYLI